MKYLITLVTLLVLTGCVTDKPYAIGKTIYVGGRAVVIQNADLLDKSTMDKLKKVDEYAKRYDKARTTVKKSLADDVATSSTLNKDK